MATNLNNARLKGDPFRVMSAFKAVAEKLDGVRPVFFSAINQEGMRKPNNPLVLAENLSGNASLGNPFIDDQRGSVTP